MSKMIRIKMLERIRVSKEIFGFLILFLTILLIMSIVSALGIRIFLVSNTKSMEPSLRHNDLVFSRRVAFDSLQYGDYVTFEVPATIDGVRTTIFITHRIIEVIKNEETSEFLFQTSGTAEGITKDNWLLSIDGSNRTARYVGRVRVTSRTLGNMIAYIRSPFGITMVIVNIGLGILVWIVIKDINTKPRRRILPTDVTLPDDEELGN